jgi:Flp pilus assembly protein TadD
MPSEPARRVWRATAAALAASVAGCASSPALHRGAAVTLDELRSGRVLDRKAAAAAAVDPAEVLAVSREMQAFLDARVARRADRPTRLRQLAHAIVGDEGFGLEYDETTRTAAETFRTRRGNCLSFSGMFVAMARRIALDAAYQEVDIPPDWSFKDDTFVLNRHVDVVVDLGRDGEHVVDFDMEDFRAAYERRRITDARALAHFFNNLAVERMQKGDTASALRGFREATGQDASFSPAWTNLGILYSREGHPAHAEAAYLQALRVDAGDLVAMSNLATLYERLGDAERAAQFRGRVVRHRERNPYYRFQRAQDAFAGGDYGGAIRELGAALRRKNNEDRFYFLMALCHLRQGDEEAARRWLARAREVAATDALKRRYDSKIDILLSGPARDDAP